MPEEKQTTCDPINEELWKTGLVSPPFPDADFATTTMV